MFIGSGSEYLFEVRVGCVGASVCNHKCFFGTCECMWSKSKYANASSCCNWRREPCWKENKWAFWLCRHFAFMKKKKIIQRVPPAERMLISSPLVMISPFLFLLLFSSFTLICKCAKTALKKISSFRKRLIGKLCREKGKPKYIRKQPIWWKSLQKNK